VVELQKVWGMSVVSDGTVQQVIIIMIVIVIFVISIIIDVIVIVIIIISISFIIVIIVIFIITSVKKGSQSSFGVLREPEEEMTNLV
jgi:energy-coupling factor transporter transmembrane protein EcfT